VGAGAMVLHILLAWLLLHVVGHGVNGADTALQGEGDAQLVVEFIAVPSSGIATPPSQPLVQKDTIPVAPRDPMVNANTSPHHTDPLRAQVLNRTGQESASDAASIRPFKTNAPAANAASNHSAAQGGNQSDDLLASYHAALRARIAQKWHDLTDRKFPSGCTLRVAQTPGGAVTAISANSCDLSNEDRLQLEAIALMAQPLPYAGYEAVFAENLDLAL
jgi:hypothetical protein